MAHHKSSIKRIRQTAKKRDQNRYYAKTTRNVVAKLRTTADKSEAEKLLPQVVSKLDKLAKRNQIHWKKAANLKSSLAVHVSKLK
ncbi:MAG: 30S ribosomal protein S20 [Chitinophagales bacterium]|nr:30S ribosomal protein S20 [Chitinophagales bacterium]